MKKVLLVTHVSGFVPQFEMENVRFLQDKGYEVHYATNYHNVSYGVDNQRLDGTGIVRHQIDFVRSPLRVFQHSKAYHQLKELMEREQFVLVHCHTPVGAALARLAAKSLRAGAPKVIYTAHGFHFFKGASLFYWSTFYPVECFLARFTDVLITINQEDYERAKKFCRHKKTKVEWIPGVGVNTAFWSSIDLTEQEKVKKREKTRQEFQLQEEEIALISVGELIPRKNHKQVIRVLGELKRQGKISKKFRYFLCGHGALEQELLQCVEQNGLQGQVVLLGYRKNLRELLSAMDYFVFPSLQEGMPMALLEAMATGLPAIISDIRGNRELIGGENSIFANEMELKQLLSEALNGECRKETAEKNVELVKAYDINRVKEIMQRIYEEAGV